MKKHGKHSQGRLAVFCLAILFFMGIKGFAEEAPSGAINAAENGLQAFLQKIPEGEFALFGFTRDDDLDNAKTGTPFQIHTITPTALSRYNPGDTVNSLISPTDVWYFPIMVDNTMKAILTVGRLNDIYKAVALGQASLTGELEKILEKWPRSEGCTPILIKVFQAKAYFFTIPEQDDYNLTSLIFEGKGFASHLHTSEENYETTFELPSVIEELSSVVEKNMGQTAP